MKRLWLNLPLLFLAALSGYGQTTAVVPAWVKETQPIRPADVPASDYAYLSAWLAENAKPAGDYFVGLFKRHDVVILGEGHNVREHKEFLIDLMPRLYHEAGVRCIGWEYSPPGADAELESLVTMPQPDPEAVLNFARKQAAAGWNSKEHWDLIEAVRKLNASLTKDQPRMRFVGLDIPVDWTDLYTKIKTAPKDSPEGREVQQWYMKRDVIMAENAERATLAKGVKAVLFVGRGHDETHVGVPPDKPYSRPIMAKVLHEKYGDRVFQVAADWGQFTVLEKAMEPHQHRAVGFDLYASPFANITNAEMGGIERRMANLARGYVYFGACRQLHGNTPIKGFVTEEMYRKHRTYYEVDFGVKFDTAREFDEYLQGRRWKLRCPATQP